MPPFRVAVPSDMLTTLMLSCSAKRSTNSSPRSSGSPPSCRSSPSGSTLTATMSAAGATPTSGSAAAAVPATCVPCPTASRAFCTDDASIDAGTRLETAL
jgi:hypothetical protein